MDYVSSLLRQSRPGAQERALLYLQKAQDISAGAARHFFQTIETAVTLVQQHTRPIWHEVQERTQPGLSKAYSRAQPYVGPCYDSFSQRANAQFEGWQPWHISLVTALTLLLVLWATQFAQRKWRAIRTLSIREFERCCAGLRQSAFNFLKQLPIAKGLVAKEQQKLKTKLKASLASEAVPGHEPFRSLPAQGIDTKRLKTRLEHKGQRDVQFEEGESRVSGTLYMAGEEHVRLLNEVYSLFSHTNPMHSDVFPSVRQMESEVVAMTADMLGGGETGDPEVCGAMTSGGTESILTAVKASRDYMRAAQGITSPEMIIGASAHAAFFKAAEYFNIKLIQIPVGKDYRLSAAAVRRHITRNTVLLVASSPGFPHGVIDDVAGLAKLARKYKICLHSDACLGGFVLPFARKLGYKIPPFDFSLSGVTSMSVDTHKFGMAHKGTSVVLYRNAELRKHQYTQITEWSGGLYISPGFAGSRSGALIATAWASMIHLGEQGYLDLTSKIMQASKQFEEGVRQMKHLEVIGEPEMCVVAFKAKNSRAVDIFVLNDQMSRRGWHLSALQLPSALHMCFTAQHIHSIPRLLQDLEEAVAEALKKPPATEDSLAPVYGMNAKMPDRQIVGDYLVCYQDALLSL